MSLFKKSFVLFSILFLFVFGLTLIPDNKADATIPVSVTAWNVATSVQIPNGGAVPINTVVRIDWKATGATSCSNTFNSSTLPYGSYQYTATSNRKFTVNCSSVNDAPSATCSSYYIGAFDDPTASCELSFYEEGSSTCIAGYTSVCFNGHIACFETSCKPTFHYFGCGTCCYSLTRGGVCIRDNSGACGDVVGQCKQ